MIIENKKANASDLHKQLATYIHMHAISKIHTQNPSNIPFSSHKTGQKISLFQKENSTRHGTLFKIAFEMYRLVVQINEVFKVDTTSATCT